MHSLTEQYPGNLQTDEDEQETGTEMELEPGDHDAIDNYPGFHIVDEATANWYLDRRAALQEKQTRYTAQYDAIMSEIDRDIEQFESRFNPELEALAQMRLAQQKGKSKTVKFLAGNVSFRSIPGGVRIVDTNAALQEAMVHFAGFVTLVPKLDTAAYRENARKVLETDGELLPGCDNVPDRESMTIKFPTRWQFAQRKGGTPA